jgi:hypothetical protein
MPPILGIIASSISAHLSNYTSIATATVTSGGSGGAISFSSIPQTYSHLQIRAFVQNTGTGSGSGGTTANVTLNGQAFTTDHYLYANGSSVSAGQTTPYGFFMNTPYSSNTNIFSAGVWDLLDYTNTTKNKVVRNLGGYDANGSGEIALISNLYTYNTNAINTITITPSSNNFSAGSIFALYGVK